MLILWFNFWVVVQQGILARLVIDRGIHHAHMGLAGQRVSSKNKVYVTPAPLLFVYTGIMMQPPVEESVS